ncbi:hypothetical protein PCLA_21r0073 [Pseudomonas citronellolis]|nr:hypothetical protein PCLA_21r0073 [Pseudomonas citronellolis]
MGRRNPQITVFQIEQMEAVAHPNARNIIQTQRKFRVETCISAL